MNETKKRKMTGKNIVSRRGEIPAN